MFVLLMQMCLWVRNSKIHSFQPLLIVDVEPRSRWPDSTVFKDAEYNTWPFSVPSRRDTVSASYRRDSPSVVVGTSGTRDSERGCS